jgi:hypothetical protein
VPLLVVVFVLGSLLCSLRKETHALHAANESAEKLVSSLKAKLALVQKEDRGAAVPTSREPSKPATREPPPGALKSYSDNDAMADPELGGPVIRRHRRYAMGNYRKAIEALHLSPEDDAKLRQLVVDRWNAEMDAADVVKRMGDAPGDLRRKAMDAAAKEGGRVIKDFVGEEAYARFEEEERVSFHATTNWMLFTALWDADLPVTSEQKVAYARSMQQVEKQFSTPDSREPADPETGLSQADLALLNSVQAFLSPEQVAFIRNGKIEDARYRALGRLKSSLKEGIKP